MSVQVPKGYKQTEVGVIPEDWSISPLGDLVLDTEYGSSAKSKPSGKIPVLRMGNLQDGAIDWSSLVFTDDEYEINKYNLELGDVLFNRTNTIDLVGKTSIYKGEMPAIFAGYLIRIKSDARKINSFYLNRALNAEYSKKYSLKVLSIAVGQANINAEKLKTYPIPLPPTLAEQDSIAEALSDADALIESLEQLIAKKRQIKQGAMQELLTGQRRLPGFSGEWSNRCLGDLGVFLKGAGVKKDEALSGNLPCIRYGEIYTKHNDWIRGFESWISQPIAATATKINYGDVLFAASGETKEEIGKCVAYVDQMEAYAGGDIIILRIKSADPLFLGYYLNTEPVRQQKSSRGQGDAVVHIGTNALAAIKVALPSMEEQKAMATVLSDMDIELAALESRLDKARQIKQSMMQELLTGRIRLI